MTDANPLRDRFASGDALLIPYGEPGSSIEVVGAFEEVGIEYARVRKACVVFDQPHVGTIEVTGSDRLAFLNSMLTQKVIDLPDGHARRSFWLNRKGRIDADLRVAELGGRALLTLDRRLAGPTAESLASYVFSEEVTIADVSGSWHRMSIHGATAPDLLARAADDDTLAPLAHGSARDARIGDVPVRVEREDTTGEPGFDLAVPIDAAGAVYDALLDAGAKPVGWFALNTARIEAGTPMFGLDFGPNNLPAESGVMASRVDTRKGCYLGQEVVARMHARNTRKQGLVAFRVVSVEGGGPLPLPATGDAVLPGGDALGAPIGAVTSSTIAPMCSGACVGFAMLRDAETAPGTELLVAAEGRRATIAVQESLAFWKRPG